MISLNSVCYGVKTRHSILHDVSLDLRPGETLGLIGPNGSGKSTLLRILSGLLRPSSGEVRLAGKPLHRMSRREISQTIAVVEQQVETSDALCARDVVELGRTPWLSALSPFGPADHEIVDAALAAVGMTDMAKAPWATMSGGERQRIQIARALAQCPKILVLDEPTNHLDIEHQLSLLKMVAGLPMTIVIAIHDLNQAMNCDRVAVLRSGRLVGLGCPEDVLTPDCLSGTFNVGSRQLRDPHDDARILRFLSLEPV